MKLDPAFPLLDIVSCARSGFILDLGCRLRPRGHLARLTAPMPARLLGIDYDEKKVRVARRTAPENPRVRFEFGDILNCDYPPCDAVVLPLDVPALLAAGKASS